MDEVVHTPRNLARFEESEDGVYPKYRKYGATPSIASTEQPLLQYSGRPPTKTGACTSWDCDGGIQLSTNLPI